jgi:hypothetical protein
MALFQDSGQTPERRDEEATEITRKLRDWLATDPQQIELFDAKSSVFLTDMLSRLRRFGSLRYVNPKMLYWLRDLKAKAEI